MKKFLIFFPKWCQFSGFNFFYLNPESYFLAHTNRLTDFLTFFGRPRESAYLVEIARFLFEKISKDTLFIGKYTLYILCRSFLHRNFKATYFCCHYGRALKVVVSHRTRKKRFSAISLNMKNIAVN